MKLIIVSGLSGSGKSVALHTLEDLGFYCVDNLPLGLLPAFTEIQWKSRSHTQAAVGIDARNYAGDLDQFPQILEKLRNTRDDTDRLTLDVEVLFLHADLKTLTKRYSESRRAHPVGAEGVPLTDAIRREEARLEPIRSLADLSIDTSRTHIHQLRDQIRKRVLGREPKAMSLLIQSFGFKHGVPGDADFVFDVRCLPNPHWQSNLRSLTGRDRPVVDFLAAYPQVETMYEQIESFLLEWLPAFQADNRSYLTVAIGCTGGQHRSVYMVERLHGSLSRPFPNIHVRHRELASVPA